MSKDEKGHKLFPPPKIDKKKYDEGWERIFGNKNKKKKDDKKQEDK